MTEGGCVKTLEYSMFIDMCICLYGPQYESTEK